MIRKANTGRRITNRRVRSVSPKAHLLDVQLRTSTRKRRRNERVGKIVFNTLLVAALAGASFFGVRAALDRFFFQNPEYTLTKITFDLDQIMTRDEALAETGLHEGVNIFSVDLAHVEAVLKADPQVESVRIDRELPDHLSISLTSRDPVAWLAEGAEDPMAADHAMMVDANGFLMHPRHIQPEYYHLPVIYGIKSDNIRAGDILQNDDLKNTLAFIATVGRRPNSLLHIRTLDVSKGYCLVVTDERNAHITFGASAADFDLQLDRLDQLLANCDQTGRTLETVNLMVKRNTPVTFVAAAAPPAESEKIASPSLKTRRN